MEASRPASQHPVFWSLPNYWGAKNKDLSKSKVPILCRVIVPNPSSKVRYLSYCTVHGRKLALPCP